MARGKKKATTSKNSRKGRGQDTYQARELTKTHHTKRDDFGPLVTLTLADEARNTSQHTSWDQNSILRQRPIAFVSAGVSEPLEKLETSVPTAPVNASDELELHEQQISTDGPPPKMHTTASEEDEASQFGSSGCRVTDSEPNAMQSPQKTDVLSDSVPETRGNANQFSIEPFFFDLKGDKELKSPAIFQSSTPNPGHRRSANNIRDSSEDEVIIFRGRDSKIKPEKPKSSSMAVTTMQAEIRVVEKSIGVASSSRQSLTTRASRGSKRRTRYNPSRHSNTEAEDALLADYVANMRENGELGNLLLRDTRNTRDIGGTEYSSSSSETSKLGHDKSLIATGNMSASDTGGTARGTRGLPSENGKQKRDLASDDNLDNAELARLIVSQEDHIIMALAEQDSSSSSGSKQEEEFGADDFDLMDWERPSLRRKKGKGARAVPNFGLSDSETEQRLQAAWTNDRLKKSQRRKQREERRVQGLLGKGASQASDPRVKYSQGINIEQVAVEIKDFLLGDEQSLTFPPMDTHARKIIHELANKFNIKSKSVGKADQRRPMLHRTLRTLPYAERTFDQAVARINRRYFPRLDIKGKNRKSNLNNTNTAAASYREGEVVGAAAPELGIENRGRAMLEKMGWSNGTALGAVDNKGILQPVPQTMKASRAGLG